MPPPGPVESDEAGAPAEPSLPDAPAEPIVPRASSGPPEPSRPPERRGARRRAASAAAAGPGASEDTHAMVLATARLRGWRALPEPNQCRCPQRETEMLMLARDGRLLAWALTVSEGPASASLQSWLAAMDAVPGVSAGLKRPSDVHDMLAELNGDPQ